MHVDLNYLVKGKMHIVTTEIVTVFYVIFYTFLTDFYFFNFFFSPFSPCLSRTQT